MMLTLVVLSCGRSQVPKYGIHFLHFFTHISRMSWIACACVLQKTALTKEIAQRQAELNSKGYQVHIEQGSL